MFKEEILLALHSVHVLNSLLHLMSPVEFNISGYFSGVGCPSVCCEYDWLVKKTGFSLLQGRTEVGGEKLN